MLYTLGTLGHIYAIKHADKALDYLTEAVKLSRRVLGENHKDTLTATCKLADAYWYAKKPDRAIPLYEEVIPKLREHFGPDDPVTTGAMFTLGWVYKDAGRLP
jgi:hypothetical protein